ncbi:MAG: glutathione S-transferase N-terminal domain-containing protein [Alphaproteobacteria bacterium]|nr:glutathione S-transferase N-terminal domain-containing protein [Alphaproteobacteria bacterium]
MLKLFYAPNACSLAPHIALNEAGAEYEAILVDTKSGEQREAPYLAINPKGRVPALATDRGILTEVPVLLAYIARLFPDAALAPMAWKTPADQFDFFEMQSFNTYLASTIHITYAHLFRPERYADSDTAKADMKAKVAGNLASQLRLVEDRFADGREWVHGAHYTVSDPYLYVFTRWLDREGAGGIGRFPKLAAHRTRMQARPAVQKTLEQEGLAPA